MRKFKLLSEIGTVCTASIIPLTMITSCTDNNKTINVSLIKGYEKLYKINKTVAPINEDLSVIIQSKDGVTSINSENIYLVTNGAEIPSNWYKIEQSLDGTQAKITLDKEDVFADIQIGVFDMDMHDYVKDGAYISKYKPVPERTFSQAIQYSMYYYQCVKQNTQIFIDDCYTNLNVLLEKYTKPTIKINALKAGFKILDFNWSGTNATITYDAKVIVDVVDISGTNLESVKFSIDLHFENMWFKSFRMKKNTQLQDPPVVTAPLIYFGSSSLKQFIEFADCWSFLKNDEKWKITCDVQLDKCLTFVSKTEKYTDTLINNKNMDSHPLFRNLYGTTPINGRLANILLYHIIPGNSHYFQNVTINL